MLYTSEYINESTQCSLEVSPKLLQKISICAWSFKKVLTSNREGIKNKGSIQRSSVDLDSEQLVKEDTDYPHRMNLICNVTKQCNLHMRLELCGGIICSQNRKWEK